MSHPEFFARQTFCQQASLLESAEARGSAAWKSALRKLTPRWAWSPKIRDDSCLALQVDVLPSAEHQNMID